MGEEAWLLDIPACFAPQPLSRFRLLLFFFVLTLDSGNALVRTIMIFFNHQFLMFNLRGDVN